MTASERCSTIQGLSRRQAVLACSSGNWMFLWLCGHFRLVWGFADSGEATCLMRPALSVAVLCRAVCCGVAMQPQ